MSTYYVMYESDKPIFDDHVIEGNTPFAAAQRAFPGKKIVPVYGDNARQADLILKECRIVQDGAAAGQVRIKNHAKTCCYLIE